MSSGRQLLRALDFISNPIEVDPQINQWLEQLRTIEVQAGQNVIELGCDSPVFTTAMARRLGPSGKLYVADSDIGKLRGAISHAARADLLNIEPIFLQADAANVWAALRSPKVDQVIYHTQRFGVSDINRHLQATCRLLAPGGTLSIFGSIETGPHVDFLTELSHLFPNQWWPPFSSRTEIQLLGQQLGLSLSTWSTRQVHWLFSSMDELIEFIMSHYNLPPIEMAAIRAIDKFLHPVQIGEFVALPYEQFSAHLIKKA